MPTSLGTRIEIPLADVDAILSTPDFDRIRLYRAGSEFGTYALLTTLTLVAGTTAYAYDDTAGLTTDWYRWTLYNTASTAESAPSESNPAGTAGTTTLLALRRAVCDRLQLLGHPEGDYDPDGPSVTTTSLGTTTTFVSTDYMDTRYPSNAYREWYAYIVADPLQSTNTGRARRIGATPLDTATGTFTVARAFPAAVSSGATLDLYGEDGLRFWNDRINEGASSLWVPFAYSFAGTTDAGGTSAQTEYPLPAYVEDDEQVVTLSVRSGTQLRGRRFTAGIDFEVERVEGGGVVLRLADGVPLNSVYEVGGFRHPPRLRNDTDTIPLAGAQVDLLVLSAAARAALLLSQMLGRHSDDRAMWTARFSQLEAERRAQSAETRTWSTSRSPRRTRMVALLGQRGGHGRLLGR